MSDKFAILWSGGKDSALALHRARKAGIEVVRLITFYDSATKRVRFHATRIEMLEAQASAIGSELRAIPTTWPEMEARLREELAGLQSQGYAGVVLGDIHLEDVRAWYEARVTGAGLRHLEPLWGEPPAELVREFVETGGRAVITCVDTTRLDASWLGRVIDERFLQDIAATGIDACGENGEYHSFAFAGPEFGTPVGWRAGQTRIESQFHQLDVLPAGAAVT